MSERRGSLTAAVKNAAPKTAAKTSKTPLAERPDREGKTPLPFWVPVSARKQLRILAAELDTTMQACMIEALNDFFNKHGKPPIA
jgi:hypothetical protein